MCKWGTNAIVRLCQPMPVSGRTEIEVDACIAPLVQALNDAGIETTGSCCGHGRGHGSIVLADGRELYIHAEPSPAAAPAWQGMEYQARVRSWVLDCFGEVIANDMTERSFRFLEEALELAQSVGCTREQAYALVDYVHSRPTGQPAQEVGGVMVTLAAFTSAAGIDMMGAAETELARINTPETIAKIRRKQASKRGVVSHAAQAALPGEWNDQPLPPGPLRGDTR